MRVLYMTRGKTTHFIKKWSQYNKTSRTKINAICACEDKIQVLRVGVSKCFCWNFNEGFKI